MKIKIIFDNQTQNKNFYTGWGFSALIGQKILFDTGADGHKLIHNLEQMEVDVDLLEAVVLSHEHWDHTGGLWELLQKKKFLKIYTCAGFSIEFKEKVKQYNGVLFECLRYKPLKIQEGIFTSGEILGKYKGQSIAEQALVLNTEKGFCVLTGCAHPGIARMLKEIKSNLNIERFFLAAGGFHLKSMNRQETMEVLSQLKKIGVEKVIPLHCTGQEQKEIFLEIYQENCQTLNVGDSIEI